MYIRGRFDSFWDWTLPTRGARSLSVGLLAVIRSIQLVIEPHEFSSQPLPRLQLKGMQRHGI